jgi:excinuclease ABC subunit C
VSTAFSFDHRIEFLSENSDAVLRQIPAAPGVVALRGADEHAEPYLTRTTDLRRRLRRLLAPPEALDDQGRPILSKRLNLRSRVRFIEWTRTGSDFESTLLMYHASRAAFGPEEARRRLRLYPPYFLRITLSHEHPRVYTTNRLSKKSLPESFGPFPSRAAAERYCDAVLDLFHLRRCYEDLHPYPGHPGCVYGEMNKCMQPCKQGGNAEASEGGQSNPQACTPEQYGDEARRVHAFFATRGQSLLDEVAQQREAASEAMDFEAAAALHKHWEKVRAASQLADEIVRPVSDLRAVIVLEAAPAIESGASVGAGDNAGAPTGVRSGPHLPAGVAHLASAMWASTEASGADKTRAAVFLLDGGRLNGPERLSTLGVRAVREQTAVGSSLFAQPLMLAPVPLDEPSPNTVILGGAQSGVPSGQPLPAGVESAESKDPETVPVGPAANPIATSTRISLSPEDRARAILDHLTARAHADPTPSIDELCDTLSLFRRWYYRPEKQRAGEVFLPNSEGGHTDSWPIRRILNGAARVVLGPPAAAPPVDREAFKDLKTKVIHPGREGVERVVPVLPKRSRTRKALNPADVAE